MLKWLDREIEDLEVKITAGHILWGSYGAPSQIDAHDILVSKNMSHRCHFKLGSRCGDLSTGLRACAECRLIRGEKVDGMENFPELWVKFCRNRGNLASGQ